MIGTISVMIAQPRVPHTQPQHTQVYGLHDNANISKDITQTQELLNTLILTGGARSNGQSGENSSHCFHTPHQHVI
jgi:hypothetical protein